MTFDERFRPMLAEYLDGIKKNQSNIRAIPLSFSGHRLRWTMYDYSYAYPFRPFITIEYPVGDVMSRDWDILWDYLRVEACEIIATTPGSMKNRGVFVARFYHGEWQRSSDWLLQYDWKPETTVNDLVEDWKNLCTSYWKSHYEAILEAAKCQ